MKKISNIAYATDSPEQMLDVYVPDVETKAVYVFFHGGGLEAGDKKVADTFADYLADRGIAMISANYRMYPNAKYPEYIQDCARVVAWSDKYMKEQLGCDRLYVGGSSAGGYLSMMLCFDQHYMKEAGIDNGAIAGYFHDAGQPTAHFGFLKYSGVDPRRVIVDESAPLYHIGVEKEYPPMRFIVSDNDMENRYEQIMLVLSTMKHYGYEHYDHIVMHGTHCAYTEAYDENGDLILGKMICDFIQHVEEAR